MKVSFMRFGMIAGVLFLVWGVLAPFISSAQSLLQGKRGVASLSDENRAIQITKDIIAGPGSLTVSGNRIAWSGPDSPNMNLAHSQVYLYDMSTGQLAQLTRGSLDSTQANLSGDNLVYSDGQNNIVLYNIATQKTEVIAAGSTYPAIAGNKILYIDNATRNLHLYDITTKARTQITNGFPYVRDVAVDGDLVVYASGVFSGAIPLHLYTISTKTDAVVANLRLPISFTLDISGNNVVFVDDVSKVGSPVFTQVFLYNVQEQSLKSLSTAPNAQSSAVTGDTVVWVNDLGGGATSVSAYSVSTQQEQNIMSSPSYKMLSRLFGNVVFWLDDQMSDNGSWQVFLKQLPGITGLVPNVILPQTTTQGVVGRVFDYQIVALNSPVSYGATGLPAGLSVNTRTGLILGMPQTVGSFSVTLSAVNSVGTGTPRTLILTFTDP